MPVILLYFDIRFMDKTIPSSALWFTMEVYETISIRGEVSDGNIIWFGKPRFGEKKSI